MKLFRNLLLLGIVTIFFANCSDSSFEQVGYFKQNKYRVFTFYINSSIKYDKDSIPNELWEKITKDGKSQKHTEGCQTQSFYYLNRSDAPDITMFDNFINVVDKAYDNKPLAVYFKDERGNEGLIKYPEQ